MNELSKVWFVWKTLSISTDYEGLGDSAATDGAESVTRPRA